MSIFKKVNVVSVDVTDWERAKKFYRETLGWPVDFSSDEAGWEEYGLDNQTHVSITRSDHAPAAHGGTTLVLTVDNAHAATAALRAKGVRCDEVVVIPGMIAYGSFYDLDGNRIQFASNPPAA
jgi:predicted enzyme related to lactoylglutathione lyase